MLKNIKFAGFHSPSRARTFIYIIYAHGFVMTFSALLIDSATVVSNNLA